MNGRIRRPLPPAGVEYVLVAGRRRRHRAVAVTAAATVAVCATFAGVAVRARGTGVDRIGVVDDGVTTPPGPAAGSVPPGPTPTAGTAPAYSSRTSPPPSRGGGAVPPGASPAVASAVPSSAPAPIVGPTSQEDGGPVMTGPTTNPVPSTCPAEGPTHTTPYCTAVEGPETVRAGRAAQFTYWICRRGVRERVTYATRQEVEMTVSAGDATRWTWSNGFEFEESEHTYVFDTGYCYSWSAEWAGQDAHGRALPPGTYTFEAYGTANGWTGGNEDPAPAAVTVRVVR